MKKSFIGAIAAAWVVSTPALAGPIVIGGVKYKTTEEGVAAYRRLSEAQMDQLVTLTPRTLVGGRWLVVLPTLQTASLTYVGITKGKPKQELINAIATTELIGLENRFKVLERAGMVDSIRFTDEAAYSLGAPTDLDYVLIIKPQIDGDRTMRGAQLRRTEVSIRSVKTGLQAPAFSLTGSPQSALPSFFAERMKAAVERLNGEMGHSLGSASAAGVGLQ